MRALRILGVAWGLSAAACSLGVDVGDKQPRPTPALRGSDGVPGGEAGNHGHGEGIAQGGADQGSGEGRGDGQPQGGADQGSGEGSGDGRAQGGADQGQGEGSAGAPGGNEVLGWFICDDGTPLFPSQDLCDQSVDCPDGSDEKLELCHEIQFACQDGTWLVHAKRCDGKVDCTTGEDEACEDAAFHCKDGEIIGGKQRCDGEPDCFDGSDEHDC